MLGISLSELCKWGGVRNGEKETINDFQFDGYQDLLTQE